MQVVSNEELMTIVGGGITATFISAIVSAGTKLFNLGRAVGSAARRIYEKKVCQIV